MRYPYPATTATGAGRGMIFYPQPMSVESLESLEAQDLELDHPDPSGSPGLVRFLEFFLIQLAIGSQVRLYPCLIKSVQVG